MEEKSRGKVDGNVVLVAFFSRILSLPSLSLLRAEFIVDDKII